MHEMQAGRYTLHAFRSTHLNYSIIYIKYLSLMIINDINGHRVMFICQSTATRYPFRANNQRMTNMTTYRNLAS